MKYISQTLIDETVTFSPLWDKEVVLKILSDSIEHLSTFKETIISSDDMKPPIRDEGRKFVASAEVPWYYTRQIVGVIDALFPKHIMETESEFKKVHSFIKILEFFANFI